MDQFTFVCINNAVLIPILLGILFYNYGNARDKYIYEVYVRSCLNLYGYRYIYLDFKRFKDYYLAMPPVWTIDKEGRLPTYQVDYTTEMIILFTYKDYKRYLKFVRRLAEGKVDRHTGVSKYWTAVREDLTKYRNSDLLNDKEFKNSLNGEAIHRMLYQIDLDLSCAIHR